MNRIVAGMWSLTVLLAFATTSAVAADPAPEKFQAKFETTKGDFVIEVTREWSPNGADRFYELIQKEFYNGCAFFRVVPGFMVQFGINGNPEIQAEWRPKTIPDDPTKQSNQPGYVTFAKTSRKDSRTTQLFINYGKNEFLDNQGFAPFGKVISGMDVVNKINSEYGEKPSQASMQTRGNAYLKEAFPNLDYIRKVTLVPVK